MEPSIAPWVHHIIIAYYTKTENTETALYLRLWCKLNNTEAKRTRVPPHCFVIVRVQPWTSVLVIVVNSISAYMFKNVPSSLRRQIK